MADCADSVFLSPAPTLLLSAAFSNNLSMLITWQTLGLAQTLGNIFQINADSSFFGLNI